MMTSPFLIPQINPTKGNPHMILEPKHRVVWKGNLWSDIVFKATSLEATSSFLGFRVYLEMTGAEKGQHEKKVFVPCSAMDFSGRPNFHFVSRQPASLLGQRFTPELESVCSFLFNDKCLVAARVHHDVLIDDFVSFKLVLLLATKSVNTTIVNTVNNRLLTSGNNIVNSLLVDSSIDSKVPISDIHMLTCSSEDVKIAEYKLSIQENFFTSDYTLYRNDLSPETFEWYNKNGGDMISLDVLVHLKDLKGAIVYDYPRDLRVKTELVYDDGTPVPTFPLVPLKNKVNASGKKKDNSAPMKLFHPTRPEPVLGKGVGSQHFSFRIEEVSAHHPNRGFKLKVSPADYICSDVFYGIMEETIIVKSKPKVPMKKRGKGGRTSILQDNPTAKSVEQAPKVIEKKNKRRKKKKTRKVSNEDVSKSSMYDKESNTITMKSATATALFTGCRGSKCLSCGEEIKAGSGLCPSHHKSDCRFNMTLVPFAISGVEGSSMSIAAVNSLKDYQEGIIEFVPDEDDYFKADNAANYPFSSSNCEI